MLMMGCVPGVWLEGSDGTDINALCRSHSERVVAVADDFCKVHLFQYPCPKLKVRHAHNQTTLWHPSEDSDDTFNTDQTEYLFLSAWPPVPRPRVTGMMATAVT